MQTFQGKVAVITGAGSGIGAALARRAAAEGMRLLLADINMADLEAVAGELNAREVALQRTDVADPEQVEALAQTCFSRFDGVDLLCNNAGVVPGGRDRPVWAYSPQDWRWVFGVNVDGVANGIRSFVPRMIADGRPAHILNTASVAGFVSGAGSAVYGASKHAVVRITEALYAGLRDLRVPIGVTMLCPGLVATRIYESERSRPEHLRTQTGDPPPSAELAAISHNIFAEAPSPEMVADLAFAGVREDRLYVFTTDRFNAPILRRMEAILSRTNPEFESLAELSRSPSMSQSVS